MEVEHRCFTRAQVHEGDDGEGGPCQAATYALVRILAHSVYFDALAEQQRDRFAVSKKVSRSAEETEEHLSLNWAETTLYAAVQHCD